jgi:hypothetical protein
VGLFYQRIFSSFADGIVSYSMPQGDLRGAGWEFFDSTYDGHWDGELRRGLGQLTDGKIGPDNFKMGYYDYERGVFSNNTSFINCVPKLAHCFIKAGYSIYQSRDSSVGIALGYELDDRGCRIRFPGREADYSPPSSAEVKECVELYLHSPNTPSWCGAQLKHRDNFTFYFW